MKEGMMSCIAKHCDAEVPETNPNDVQGALCWSCRDSLKTGQKKLKR